MRVRYVTLAVLAAATPLVAAACGGDDSGDSNSSPTAAVTTAAPADSAPAAPADEPTIVISDFTFNVVEAKAGTITIRNDDGASHTVTADDGSFDVTIAGGETATIEVATPGSYSFKCKFHSSMKATLVVV
jgi:plastocyanin